VGGSLATYVTLYFHDGNSWGVFRPVGAAVVAAGRSVLTVIGQIPSVRIAERQHVAGRTPQVGQYVWRSEYST
jgi:hypothetical protein